MTLLALRSLYESAGLPPPVEMVSKAKAIARLLAQRVTLVTKANGYATDIGSTVFRGKLKFEETELPCCVMVEGEDETLGDAIGNVNLRQHYIFEGHAMLSEPEDFDNPNDLCHDIVSDLKRVLFAASQKALQERTYGALIKKMEYVGRFFGVRKEGANSISAGIEIAIEYTEKLSDPMALTFQTT